MPPSLGSWAAVHRWRVVAVCWIQWNHKIGCILFSCSEMFIQGCDITALPLSARLTEYCGVESLLSTSDTISWHTALKSCRCLDSGMKNEWLTWELHCWICDMEMQRREEVSIFLWNQKCCFEPKNKFCNSSENQALLRPGALTGCTEGFFTAVGSRGLISDTDAPTHSSIPPVTHN